jgi:hypothetical protein
MIDGQPTFDRRTTLQIRTPALGATTVDVPVKLGGADFYRNSQEYSLIILPGSGSTFTVIAKKGAVAATYPASTSMSDLLRNHLEQTTIDVTIDDSNVRLAILSPILQNQAGVIAYQIIAWGPLPWVTGSLMLIIIGVFGRRLTDWLDQVLKRAIPQRSKKKASALRGETREACIVSPDIHCSNRSKWATAQPVLPSASKATTTMSVTVAHLGIWLPSVTRSIGECRMSLWSAMVVSFQAHGSGGSCPTASLPARTIVQWAYWSTSNPKNGD